MIAANEERSVQLEKEALRVVRGQHLAEKVIFVDGLPGCGKTMLSPIIGALPRVELMQYSYPIEYVCSLRYLGRIEEDAASILIRLFTDLHLYNAMMGRETNFRPSDLSGVLRNSHPLRYFRRLVQAGDEAVVKRIDVERPILNLTTHHILGFSSPILAALGSRVLIVEVVRHPLYMIRQQALYMDRYGTDVRDFTVWHDYQEVAVPYFALGWEEVFLNSNAVEKAIYMVHYLTERLNRLGLAVDSSRKEIMIVPFERYVVDPWPYMKRVEELLGTVVDSHTRRMMKKQNVPRKMYAEGIGLNIYKKYGWEPPQESSNEAKEFERRRQFAAEHASAKAMEVLDRLCAEYEKKHLEGTNR